MASDSRIIKRAECERCGRTEAEWDKDPECPGLAISECTNKLVTRAYVSMPAMPDKLHAEVMSWLASSREQHHG